MEYQKVWDKVLNSDEEVRYEFSVGNRFRKVCLIYTFIFALLFLLVWPISLLILLFGITYYFYSKVANAYAFTDKRILIHTGIFSTKATSINYDKITEVSVEEKWIMRITTRSGDLIVHTANMTDGIKLKNIENPYEIKKKLDSLRNR